MSDLPPNLVFRAASPEDLPAATALVHAVYLETVAPLYTDEGNRVFTDFIRLHVWADRQRRGHPSWIAIEDGVMIGVLHIRDGRHVSLLFVAPEHQRRGIARRLLDLATRQLPPEEFKVNASPNSVDAYAHLGFSATGPEETMSGIRYTPMRRPLAARR